MKEFIKSEFKLSTEKENKDKIVFIPNQENKSTSTVGSMGNPYWCDRYDEYNTYICGVSK